MTILLWYVFGIAVLAFNLLTYMLVVQLHGEHQELYKELGEPSAFHFLVNRPSYFSHPFVVFIFKRQYCAKLQALHGLLLLSRGIFSMFIVAVISGLMLVARYA